MKVILTQELKGRGSEGDVIEVARGFAVNYLFPRNMAIQATSGNLRQLEARRHNIEKREMARRTDAESIAARLEGKSIVIGAKVGETGRLYGSVTAQMVEDAILEQLDVDIDRRRLDVHGHIKELGEHPVTVSLHRDVKIDVLVRVVAEGEPVKEEAVIIEELIAETEGETAAEETETVQAEVSEADVSEGDTAEAVAEGIVAAALESEATAEEDPAES